jgi:PAS domain S-box-containing protein
MSSDRVLERQLRKAGIDRSRGATPGELSALLDLVRRTYRQHAEERDMLERSITVSSAEMRELHASLRAERDRFRIIFECAPVGMMRVGRDCTILEANGPAAEMVGYLPEAMAGQRADEFVDPEELATTLADWDAIMSGRVQHLAREIRLRHADGSLVWGFASVALIAEPDGSAFGLVVVRDITQRKRLEVELRVAQKLEAVGRLASGIAHEINTPIQFIGDNVRFLRTAFEDLVELCRVQQHIVAELAASGSPAADAAAAAVQEADFAYLEREVPAALDASADGVSRVATIVRAMRAFAHPDSGNPATADLNAALQSTLTVARNEIKYVADVETRFGEIPAVTCFLGDLNQVFLNLFVNAAHAMADVQRETERRGTLRVATCVEGDEVVVTVSDTGCGIAPEHRDKVYDPFFTTKGVGRGTGQGLSLARAIVDRHHGSIRFDSQVGVGTTFEVRLPVAGPAQKAA